MKDNRKTIALLVALLLVTVGALVFVIQLSPPRDGTVEPVVPERDSPEGVTDVPADNGLDEEGGEVSPTGTIYLVLDDGGHNMGDLEAWSAFAGTFTLAVLPQLEFSTAVAERAIEMGASIMLHQPMEPMGDANPGPAAIYTTSDDEEISAVLWDNIRSLPDVVGINNHMGSKATTDRRVMDVVSTELRKESLFFLDSRTSAESVGAVAARAAGIDTVSRDVFLDNVHEPDAIRIQLEEALDVARRRGYVVAIGHVTVPELATVMIEEYDAMLNEGFRFAAIDTLFAE